MKVKDPSEVHKNSPQYSNHVPTWARWKYDGGPYRHDYRACSYCGCIHPEDLLVLIKRGGVSLEGTGKDYKRYFILPNPIVGRRCRVGSKSGPVFKRPVPRHWWSRLFESHDMPLDFGRPTLRERLRGHYNRPLYGTAPATIHQKFYFDHVTREEWGELMAAMGYPR